MKGGWTEEGFDARVEVNPKKTKCIRRKEMSNKSISNSKFLFSFKVGDDMSLCMSAQANQNFQLSNKINK